jgi:hypothetical protein
MMLIATMTFGRLAGPVWTSTGMKLSFVSGGDAEWQGRDLDPVLTGPPGRNERELADGGGIGFSPGKGEVCPIGEFVDMQRQVGAE